MMKDCLYMRGREKLNEKVYPTSPSEQSPRRKLFFALKSRGLAEETFVDFSDV